MRRGECATDAEPTGPPAAHRPHHRGSDRGAGRAAGLVAVHVPCRAQRLLSRTACAVWSTPARRGSACTPPAASPSGVAGDDRSHPAQAGRDPSPKSRSSAARRRSSTSRPCASIRPGSRASARLLRGTGVGVCSVVGFPLGATTADVKHYETRRAIFDGAREIDMVINVGALKSGDLRIVERDIEAVVDPCRECGVDQQGDHRSGAAHRRREGHRVHAGEGGRRRLRQDLDRLRPGRRDGRRRGADAPGRRRRDGRQGRRRRPRPAKA